MKSVTMLSGGSLPSWSLTWFASTVNVHVSPSVSGHARIERERGRPAAEGCRHTSPLTEQDSVNQEPVTLTGSLKVTDRLAFDREIGRPVHRVRCRRLPALRPATAQGLSGEAVLRGVGALAAKSRGIVVGFRAAVGKPQRRRVLLKAGAAALS